MPLAHALQHGDHVQFYAAREGRFMAVMALEAPLGTASSAATACPQAPPRRQPHRRRLRRARADLGQRPVHP